MFITEVSWLVLFKEVIAFSSENCSKPIHTVGGKQYYLLLKQAVHILRPYLGVNWLTIVFLQQKKKMIDSLFIYHHKHVFISKNELRWKRKHLPKAQAVAI